jgi:hypothetical protein
MEHQLTGQSIDDFIELSEQYKIPEAELELKYYFEYRSLKDSRLYSEEMCCFASMNRLIDWLDKEKPEYKK